MKEKRGEYWGEGLVVDFYNAFIAPPTLHLGAPPTLERPKDAKLVGPVAFGLPLDPFWTWLFLS